MLTRQRRRHKSVDYETLNSQELNFDRRAIVMSRMEYPSQMSVNNTSTDGLQKNDSLDSKNESIFHTASSAEIPNDTFHSVNSRFLSPTDKTPTRSSRSPKCATPLSRKSSLDQMINDPFTSFRTTIDSSPSKELCTRPNSKSKPVHCIRQKPTRISSLTSVKRTKAKKCFFGLFGNTSHRYCGKHIDPLRRTRSATLNRRLLPYRSCKLASEKSNAMLLTKKLNYGLRNQALCNQKIRNSSRKRLVGHHLRNASSKLSPESQSKTHSNSETTLNEFNNLKPSPSTESPPKIRSSKRLKSSQSLDARSPKRLKDSQVSHCEAFISGSVSPSICDNQSSSPTKTNISSIHDDEWLKNYLNSWLSVVNVGTRIPTLKLVSLRKQSSPKASPNTVPSVTYKDAATSPITQIYPGIQQQNQTQLYLDNSSISQNLLNALMQDGNSTLPKSSPDDGMQSDSSSDSSPVRRSKVLPHRPNWSNFSQSVEQFILQGSSKITRVENFRKNRKKSSNFSKRRDMLTDLDNEHYMKRKCDSMIASHLPISLGEIYANISLALANKDSNTVQKYMEILNPPLLKEYRRRALWEKLESYL